MGFALPSGVVNTDSAYFYADTSLTLGPLVKDPQDQTLVIIDYSNIDPPIGVTGFSFAVDVSSNPALVVSYPQINVTGKLLTFLLSGGITGQQYNITVTIDPGTIARADVFTVNIPNEACDCTQINPVPQIYGQLPIGSFGYINTAIRFFWGNTPPANPNVLDQWYNSDTLTLYEWTTDGTDFQWTSLYSPELVTDAPSSGLLYSRFNGHWLPDIIQTDAPADAQGYMRSNGAWIISPLQSDAPNDGHNYGRKNAAWIAIPASISDAPVDANLYGRRDGAWALVPPSISDAPMDGILWARKNTGWQPVPVQDDAPNDGQSYIRNNRQWLSVPITNYITDAPTDGTLYGRQNSTWVEAYAASNPAGYQTASDVAAAVAPMMPKAGGIFTGAIGTPGLVLPNGPASLQITGGQPGQILVASNVASTFGWGPAPIPEVPIDGVSYARKDGAWVPTASGAGLPEAPVDGTTYSRNNATWVHLAHTDITDWDATLAALLAPYALISMIPLGSISFPLVDSVAAIGTSLRWARADHVHDTDPTRYAASNPAGYQTAAQVAAALVPYALITSVPIAANTPPLMNGAVAPGASAAYSRADHVHPNDTTRLALTGGVMTGILTLASNPVGNLDAATKQYVDNATIDCGTF